MAPPYISSPKVIPACISCNFKVYPFHRPVQNKCSELVADKRQYLQHRQRIFHAHSTIYPKNRKNSSNLNREYGSVAKLIEKNNVDVLIDDVITKINRLFMVYNHDDRHKPKSLNATKRKRELQRIGQENDSLYRRLTNQKSCYPIKQMEKDWKHHQELFTRISKYPINNMVKQERQSSKKLILPPIQPRTMEIITKNKIKISTGTRMKEIEPDAMPEVFANT